MDDKETSLPGVLIVEPDKFTDARGFFLETYRRERYAEAGLDVSFVQDNHSRSRRGVIRGLHYQEPGAQGKLVHVARGRIFDVAVDIRRGSPHFGAWTGVELSDENARQIWIPAGFAHGFVTLSEEADIMYKCTGIYLPEHEHTIRWDDPDIGIGWPDAGGPPVSSEKDEAGQPLAQAVLPIYRE